MVLCPDRQAFVRRIQPRPFCDRPPDILVADIGMPGEDGYELIRKVRALSPFDQLPAMALTPYAGAEERAQLSPLAFNHI
jgi:CheY-like chemotaxis protein